MTTFPTIDYLAQQLSEALKEKKLEGERLDLLSRTLRSVYLRGKSGEDIDGEFIGE